MTHYSIHLAVETDSAEEASALASSFLEGYPEQTDWFTVVAVLPAADANGELNPAIRKEFEEVISWKDEEIRRGMRTFSPITGKAEGVVMALREPSSDDEVRQEWTEALKTGGKSMTAHHTEPDSHSPGMSLWRLKRTLRLMDDAFHNEVGYYDTEYGGTTLYPLEERVASNPAVQWVVHIDAHF